MSRFQRLAGMGYLAEAIAPVLLLEVPTLDSPELEGMLLTAWSWKDACWKADHAS